MRPLHNSSIRHSGLDPESRKYLIILDSRFRGNDGSGMDSRACPGLRFGIRRNDKIAGFMQLCKGLTFTLDSRWSLPSKVLVGGGNDKLIIFSPQNPPMLL